jgi:hypothetical protein
MKQTGSIKFSCNAKKKYVKLSFTGTEAKADRTVAGRQR